MMASQKITTILDTFGVSYQERAGRLLSSCPCYNHQGDRDNLNAFSYSLDKSTWCCFSHHCHVDVGQDIIGLVRAIKNCAFTEAVEWLRKFIDNNISETEQVNLNRSIKKIVSNKNFRVNEDRLKYLDFNRIDLLLQRGFSKSVLQKFQVGFWSRLGTFMHDRLVIPIRDENGLLVGFSGRTIYPESEWHSRSIDKKWKHGSDYVQHISGSLKISDILFNLYNAKKYLGEKKSVVLVEGPCDGFKLDMAGIYNWCAIMGSSLSLKQQKLLIDTGVNNINLCLDGDKPGVDAAKRINNIIGKIFTVHITTFPEGRDPGDLSVDEIKNILGVHI